MKASRIFLGLALLAGFSSLASAQTILLKDGKSVVTKGLRRQGDTIMATVDMVSPDPNLPARTGELGYPLAQIAKIDFPEPGALRTAADLIPQGKAMEALSLLDPVVRYYEGFRDAPGSWWVDSAMLKARALIALGRDSEADPIALQVTQAATSSEALRAAEVVLASGLVRKGQLDKALQIADRAIKESKEDSTQAAAYVIKAQVLLAQKEWEDALLAFLNVPVFYPNERILLPQALLGVGKAEFGLEDFTRSKAALQQVITTYAAAPEAKQAQTTLELVLRREKALAPAK